MSNQRKVWRQIGSDDFLMTRLVQHSPRKVSAGGPPAQGKLLSFLLNPASYAHGPQRVRLIQTHSAMVFVARPFVYKIKKAVNFGFLDFSTLERRRAACERELVLNRRLCEGVYLEVLPISFKGGRLAWGDHGRIVEYAIRMKYLSESRMLDHLVLRGKVSRRDLGRIARVLAEFYRSQHPTAEVEQWGRPARLRVSTEENFTQAREFVGRTLSQPAYDAICCYTRRFFQRSARLLRGRVREGRIRDCHGDLHMDHIHLTPGALHIYDCIEFNDRFRYVDVANDIAFLAMDLDHAGRRDLAHELVSRVGRALKDRDLGRLIPFYKCYRAYVRGKVESLHSVAPSAPAEERSSSAERASGYFRLALRYAIGASEPMVLAVIGRIGSGKSSIARALGAELGWEVVSSDAVRKKLAGVPLYVRSGNEARKRLYAEAMTKRTYQALIRAAERAAHEGNSVILDATFGRRAQRSWLRKALRTRRVAVRFLELRASDRAVRRRLRLRENHPAEISDARIEDFPMLSEQYEPASELPSSLGARLPSEGPLDQVVAAALVCLAKQAADTGV